MIPRWSGLLLDADADILDDTGVSADPEFAEVAAERVRQGLLAHRCAEQRIRLTGSQYTDVVRDVAEDLATQAEKLVALGIPKEAILIDTTQDVGHVVGTSTRPGVELRAIRGLT